MLHPESPHNILSELSQGKDFPFIPGMGRQRLPSPTWLSHIRLTLKPSPPQPHQYGNKR